MSTEKLFAYVFALSVFTLVVSQSCPFNNNCTCNHRYNVTCFWDIPQFPIFNVFNTTAISYVDIFVTYNGSETLVIPPNAFVNLQSLQNNTLLYFINNNYNCTVSPKIEISQGAFNTFNETHFGEVHFDSLFFPNLASDSFFNSQIGGVYFQSSCIDVIEDYAFRGLIAVYIQMINIVGYRNPFEQQALAGINFTCCSSTITFVSAGMTDLQPFKYATNINVINVNYNPLINVGDFSFCTCNSLNQCNNTDLQEVYLVNNTIQYVSANAFANLPTLSYIDLSHNKIQTISLTNIVSSAFYFVIDLSNNLLMELSVVSLPLTRGIHLYLSNNQLAAVPTPGIQSVQASLSYLDLSNNNITRIGANDFYNFTHIQTLFLNYNPIFTIEPGAFNSLTDISSLTLANLYQLKSIDLLITYGTHLQSLSIMDDSLDTLYIIDPSKLPETLLRVTVSQVYALKRLDPSLESWLKFRSTNVYDFSYNPAFPCTEEIQWMSKYAMCSPVQIETIQTMCQDGTSLISYLQTFNPSC